MLIKRITDTKIVLVNFNFWWGFINLVYSSTTFLVSSWSCPRDLLVDLKSLSDLTCLISRDRTYPSSLGGYDWSRGIPRCGGSLSSQRGSWDFTLPLITVYPSRCSFFIGRKSRRVDLLIYIFCWKMISFSFSVVSSLRNRSHKPFWLRPDP